jgi:hypothetical protein
LLQIKINLPIKINFLLTIILHNNYPAKSC